MHGTELLLTLVFCCCGLHSLELYAQDGDRDKEYVELQLHTNPPIVYVETRASPNKADLEAFYGGFVSGRRDAARSPSTNPRLYPNGEGTVTWPVQVTDGNGDPVPGVTVTFAVTAVRPTGNNWRTANGVVARYGTNSRPRVRRAIANGTIRLLGTMRQTSVVTDVDGVAEGVYQVSHIAGNQAGIAQERITATIDAGSATLNVDIGYDWLDDVPTVAGGLRIQGATGTHTHRDLVARMTALGEAVRDAGWPHPVTVTAGTLRWGGLYPPHFSHQWGAEFDLRPMTTDGRPATYNDANYDRSRTQLLVNALASLGAGTIYFNDPNITGVTALAGHDNHLHVSFAAKGSTSLTDPNGKVRSVIRK